MSGVPFSRIMKTLGRSIRKMTFWPQGRNIERSINVKVTRSKTIL